MSGIANASARLKYCPGPLPDSRGSEGRCAGNGAIAFARAKERMNDPHR